MKKKIKNVVEFVVLLLLIVFTAMFIFDFVVSDKLTTIDIVKNYLIIFGLIGLCFLFVDIVANRIKEDINGVNEIKTRVKNDINKQIEKEFEDKKIIKYPDNKEIAIEFLKWYFKSEWFVENNNIFYSYRRTGKYTISELFDIFLNEYKSKENEK